jgi:hypothetical protein
LQPYTLITIRMPTRPHAGVRALTDVLNFFFANYIVLFLWKYQDIGSSRSYSNLATQLFDADPSVNLGGVDFRSLLSQSGNDVRSNLLAKNFFTFVEGPGTVLCNRVHDLFSIYQ